MSVLKHEKQKIAEYLPERYSFICFSSFEERCLSIPSVLSGYINQAYMLRNIEMIGKQHNEENSKKIKELIKGVEEIHVDIRSPITIVSAVARIIRYLIEKKEREIVVDITAFTHEALLILLRLLFDNYQYFQDVIFLYNGAKNYSYGDTTEKMWLSRGCRNVRNVFGYPGKIDPMKKNHLIVLTGYEMERATRTIELLAPDKLTLGTGNEPTEAEHGKVMDFFKDKFDDWKKNYTEATKEPYIFSCSDVEQTTKLLIETTDSKKDNYLIVPLNTKLSTISIGVAALKNQNIRVCYGIPEIYNMNNYSEPSENVIIVSMKQIFDTIRR